MHRRWRISLLGAVILVTGCVGGPVSDLPHSGTDNGDPDHGHGNLDAGTASGGSSRLDAAVPVTEASDGGVPCDDAGADAAP